jgi:iron complex outermembrane receptor protein
MMLTKSSPLIAGLALGLALHAASARAQTPDLSTATIEDLMKIQVTSVSKKQEQLFRTPAAAFVLTNEAIRRSGATTIPDALRLVPGIQVAQIDGNKWAITARGFNGLWANKLLVLIDGRVVYTPVSSGVYWDLQDFPLDDIDRIEVIRGAGSAIWGANAVNGVINIISKSAMTTRGGLASISTGSIDRRIASARYGGALGAEGAYRVFVKQSDRGQMVDGNLEAAHDQSRLMQAGFRIDLDTTARDSLTLQGAALNGESGQRTGTLLQTYAPTVRGITTSISPIRARSVLGRWTRAYSSQSSLSVQAFWDHSYRKVVGKWERTQTIDTELQHRFRPAPRHDLVWGVGQRFSSDTEQVAFAEYFTPAHGKQQVFSAFAQDEMTLAPGRLNLTLGAKLEHNTFAGFELQPTARLAWFPTPQQAVWTAFSRAARTPSRLERALFVDYAAFPGAGGSLVVLGVRGGTDLETEHANSSEFGYRFEPRSDLAFDVATYYSVYDNLRTEHLVTGFTTVPVPHVTILRQYVNGTKANTYGLELLARWSASRRVRLNTGYTAAHTRLRDIGNSAEALEQSDRSPTQQWQAGAQLDLAHGWTADASVLRVGRLHSIDVPAYSRVDIRVGGPLAQGLDLSFVGQNLLDAHHWEFGSFEGIYLSQARRNGYLKLTWQF